MLVGQVVDVDLLLGLLQLRRSDMAAPSETREQAESRVVLLQLVSAWIRADVV